MTTSKSTVAPAFIPATTVVASAAIKTLIEGYSWTGTTGQAATVHYSFNLNSGVSDSQISGNALMNGTQQGQVLQALQQWANVANITFVASSGLSDINYRTANMPSGVAGWMAPTTSTATQLTNADVVMDKTYNSDMSVGTYQFMAVMHETGHALGLKHPGNYNAGGGGATGPFLPTTQDSHDLSIMSYNDGHYTNSSNHNPETPMLYDIAAMQFLYGANHSYNSGNTNYVFDGSNHVETIWDGAGTDTINASTTSSNNTIDLREGVSNVSTIGQTNLWMAFGANIENATGGSGNDMIYGNALANLLTGGSGNDTLCGDVGNDTLIGGSGTDKLDGGVGDDYFTVTGTDTVTADAGNDTIDASGSSFTCKLDGGDGNDSITGGTAAESITGGNGNDTISGGTGNNTVDGGAGDDSITAGNGNDSIIGGAGNDTINAGDGANTVTESAGNNSITTGTGDDHITGGTGNDIIDAGAGNNTITDKGGINSITVGDGNDTITGGSGNDTIHAGEGNNNVKGGAGTNVIVTGAGDDTITGGSGNDTITAGAGNNTIADGGGSNSITCGAGDDHINGGAGNDTIDAGAGNNIITDKGGTNTITCGGGADSITGGSGNDTITAGDGADTINGGAGNDSMLGGNGDDTFIGSVGNDTMVGGAGNDVFNFIVKGGLDIITDFQGAGDTVGDVIDVSSAIYTSVDILLTHLTYSGGNAIIDLGVKNGSITLVGISSGLNNSDFAVV